MITQKDVERAEEVIKELRFGKGKVLPITKMMSALDTVLEILKTYEPNREPKRAAGVWHPIDYMLPEDGEEVLVSLTPNGVHGKKVDIDCFMMSDIKYWKSGKVEAWMPKPEPYTRKG